MFLMIIVFVTVLVWSQAKGVPLYPEYLKQNLDRLATCQSASYAMRPSLDKVEKNKSKFSSLIQMKK